MKQVLIVHLNEENETEEINFLGQDIRVLRRGCGGDPDRAEAIIAEYDGKVDAVGLDGLPARLQLGPARRAHVIGQKLAKAAQHVPVVDGSGVRAALERWSVILADRAQPGIFSEKRVLLTPGLNHNGVVRMLNQHRTKIRYADPNIYFGLPGFPGVGAEATIEQAGPRTLEMLEDAPFRRLRPQPGTPGTPRAEEPFQWADLIAGDIGAVRRYAPDRLKRKIVMVESATEEDVTDLRDRGVSWLITMMPSLTDKGGLGRHSAAEIEAVLVAVRASATDSLTEDTYLGLLSNLDWQPYVRELQPDEAGINRFAFVIHPLSMKFIHGHKLFRWTRYLPDPLVERVAAYIPPMHISTITGAVSPTTGQRIEGHLIALGATPKQMMRHDENFTYKRLNQAARMSERLNARIMGLGAFTSVVGDAGVTVANEADIAITSGNSLTVAATLEAAKQAVVQMGAEDLTHGKAMIIGATGSIGRVCSRLIAQAIYDVVLVSTSPEKLIELKRTIQEETPGANVAIATRSNDLIHECDLIITTTSAFGQRILDITKCKPGAVICDVARPPDISDKEAALRPDVLVIESGEVLIPGDINFGYDIGLPPGTAYACLAETALLAMDGRFEDYTLGRDINMVRVKEIFRMFKKHEFQIAGLRTGTEFVNDEMIAAKRELADKFRQDPAYFAEYQAEASAKLAKMPVMAKGVPAGGGGGTKERNWKIGLAAGAAALALLIWRRR